MLRFSDGQSDGQLDGQTVITIGQPPSRETLIVSVIHIITS